MENIVIEENQSEILRISLLNLLMTVLSGILLMFSIKKNMFICELISIVGLLFFGSYTVYHFMHLSKPKKLITITTDGIEDHFGNEYIPFSEVKRFEIVNVFGQKMLGVIPKDTERFISNISAAKQRTARANMKMMLPPLTIRVDTALDMSIEDILSLLKKRLSDYSSLYS